MRARWVFAPSFMAALGAIACQTLLGIDPNPLPSVAKDSEAPALTDAASSSDTGGKDAPTPSIDAECSLKRPPEPPIGSGESGANLKASFVLTSFNIPDKDLGYDLDGWHTVGPETSPCRQVTNPFSTEFAIGPDILQPTNRTCGIDNAVNVLAAKSPFINLSDYILKDLTKDKSNDLCNLEQLVLTLSDFNGLADDSNVKVVLGLSPKAFPTPSQDAGADAAADSGADASAPLDARPITDPNPCYPPKSGGLWDPSLRVWEEPQALTSPLPGYVRNSQLVVELKGTPLESFPVFTVEGLTYLQGGYLLADLQKNGPIPSPLSTSQPLLKIEDLLVRAQVSSTLSTAAVVTILRKKNVSNYAPLVCQASDLPYPPRSAGSQTTDQCNGMSITLQISMTQVRTNPRVSDVAPQMVTIEDADVTLCTQP